MQQLPDDRAADLAAANQRLEQIIARIPFRNQRMDRLEKRLLASQEPPAQRQDPALPSAVNISERCDQPQDRALAIQERIANLLEQVTQLRGSTRRLWLFLAKLHGWPEDELDDIQTDTLT